MGCVSILLNAVSQGLVKVALKFLDIWDQMDQICRWNCVYFQNTMFVEWAHCFKFKLYVYCEEVVLTWRCLDGRHPLNTHGTATSVCHIGGTS